MKQPVQPVRFKLTYEVLELNFTMRDRSEIEISVTDPKATDFKVAVTIRQITREEIDRGKSPHSAIATIVLEREVSEDVRADLERFADDPELGLDTYDEGTQKVIDDIDFTLTSTLRRTIGIIRWRHDYLGPPQPYLNMGAWFSLDNDEWHQLPRRMIARTFKQRKRVVNDRTIEDVEKLVRAGFREPLAYELLREAQSLLHETPRSALIMGAAAVEVGLKVLIADLVPNARWLALNAPSPPISMMLREYLPLLPARLLINGRVLPPPQEHLEAIQKLFRARNVVAHAGAKPPSWSELRNMLAHVADVVWLFAFYEGHFWAIRNFSATAAMELGLMSKPYGYDFISGTVTTPEGDQIL